MSRTLNQFPLTFCNEYTQFKRKCCYKPLIIFNRTPINNFAGVVVLAEAEQPTISSNLNTSSNFQQTYLIDPTNILFGKNRCIKG